MENGKIQITKRKEPAMTDFFELLQTRRSIRQFEDKEVALFR
jgi:hypothetical protein